jgi:serine/threonine protein phosphatase PrpC
MRISRANFQAVLRTGYELVQSKSPFKSVESARVAWQQGLQAAAAQQNWDRRLPDLRPKSQNFVERVVQDFFYGPKKLAITDSDFEFLEFLYPTEACFINGAAVASNRGRSFHDNEDRYAVLEGLTEGVNAYALFDGHGSEECAEFCCERVKDLAPILLPKELTPLTVSNYLHDLMLQLDDEFLAISDGSGTTAVFALELPSFDGNPGKDLVIANVGDSRGIFLPSGGEAQQITEDADPSLPQYTKEVSERGGSVLGGRVQGRLKVARSLGDHWSKGIVSAAPTLAHLQRPEGMLVLVTDGVTDVATSDEIHAFLKAKADLSLKEKAALLVQAAFTCDSTDNLTALIKNVGV